MEKLPIWQNIGNRKQYKNPLKNKPKVDTPKWINESITKEEMSNEELEELRKELNIWNLK